MSTVSGAPISLVHVIKHKYEYKWTNNESCNTLHHEEKEKKLYATKKNPASVTLYNLCALVAISFFVLTKRIACFCGSW